MYLKLYGFNTPGDKVMNLLRIKTVEYEENLIGVNDFKETWAKIENWQVSFIIYESKFNEFEYNLLANEQVIVFEEQEFVIKNCEILSTGLMEAKKIEATHISYNIQDHTQDEINEGNKTYSIKEVLDFGISKNELGYTYEIVGEFDKVQIENFGDVDGLEVVMKVCNVFGAVMIPNNKHFYFYREDSWTHLTQNQFRDGYNTQGMSISIDTTNMKTAVKGFGMKKEDGTWYFQPFSYISPNVKNWNNGKPKWMKPIRDETINNPETMLAKMKRSLIDYPEVSLSTNTIEIDRFGKGDVWTYINDRQKIVTDVIITGYTRYPFDGNKGSEVVFSNSKKAMTDIQGDIARAAKNAERELQNPSNFVNSQISSYIKDASKAVNMASKSVRFHEEGISTSVPIRAKKKTQNDVDDVLIGSGAIWLDGKKAIDKNGIDASYLYNIDGLVPELPVYEIATPSKDGLMASEMVVKLNDLKKVATAWSNGLMSMKDKSKLDLINVTKQIDLDKLQQDVEKLKGVK